MRPPHNATSWTLPIGSLPDSCGTRFRVWAENARHTVTLILYERDGKTISAQHPMIPDDHGYFSLSVAGVKPGTRYRYQIDDRPPLPDPASRAQPDGVHGASAVVDLAAFRWTDAGWRGLPLDQLIIYEVHVGTATPEGTFESLIGQLDALVDLGITALELMPVADFPGTRNWGYDGVNLFAPARAYGGAIGLQRLVNAAHSRGLAVLLDVVYNHLGPDGNYLRQFSERYFTDLHHTPWGSALNLDDPDCPQVREYFIANACSWLHEYHLDGLRLDATHAIVDTGDTPFLRALAEQVRAQCPPDRHFLLMAEDERNLPRLAQPLDAGGYGLDGIWADDFHHQVRVMLTGEQDGYYQNYSGSAPDLARTIQQGWFYTGQIEPQSGHARGASADSLPYPAFIYCIQNHDQVGNRATGDRLHHTVALDRYRVASALLLLAPATPLLFMGQEWAASTPFLFFTDHHPELGRQVTQGRRAEFAEFTAFTHTEVPDPQALATFTQSRLHWAERDQPPHIGILRLYQHLIALRRTHPALQAPAREQTQIVDLTARTLMLQRTSPDGACVVAFLHFGDAHVTLNLPALMPVPLTLVCDSEAAEFGGSGALPTATVIHLHTPRALVFASA